MSRSTNSSAPACVRMRPSASSRRCSTTSAQSMLRASMPFRGSAARRIRTSTPTGSFARAIRHFSTFCTAIRATAPATTALSRWARRVPLSTMRTRLPANTWIAPSRWCVRVRPPPTSSRYGRRRRSSAFPTKRPRSRCSTGTESGSRFGRSRFSRDWFRSSIPRCSKRAWCSPSKPTGRRRTALAPLASRRSLLSPLTAAR